MKKNKTNTPPVLGYTSLCGRWKTILARKSAAKHSCSPCKTSSTFSSAPPIRSISPEQRESTQFTETPRDDTRRCCCRCCFTEDFFFSLQLERRHFGHGHDDDEKDQSFDRFSDSRSVRLSARVQLFFVPRPEFGVFPLLQHFGQRHDHHTDGRRSSSVRVQREIG